MSLVPEPQPARTDASAIQPSGEVIAAMFEDRASAEDARDSLVAAGLAPGGIDIVDQPAATGHVTDEQAHAVSHGIWTRIREMFVPHPHAHGYAEAVERGHALLFVRGSAGEHARIITLLEQQHPIDVMTRVQEWRAAGWSGVHRSQAASPDDAGAPQMLFEDHPYQDHIPATGLINENDHLRPIGAPLVNPMGIEVPGVRVSGSNRVRRYEPEPGMGPLDTV
jgi:hypothetical protein